MNREMAVAEWRRALEALGAAEVLMLSAKGLTEQELAPERGDG